MIAFVEARKLSKIAQTPVNQAGGALKPLGKKFAFRAEICPAPAEKTKIPCYFPVGGEMRAIAAASVGVVQAPIIGKSR